MRSRHRRGNVALIVFLLCATVCAQSAALAGEHTPHHATDHCCLLCHIGVLPFLQAHVQVSIAPAAPVEWLAGTPDLGRMRDALLVSRSTRAPPTA